MIIGLVGRARSGKDTVASLMAQHHVVRWDVQKYAFAYPIKEHVNRMFGWDSRHADGNLKEVVDPYWGFSPRHAYQTFGTDWARDDLRQDIWLKFAERAMDNAKHTIITDVRFHNEAEWIRKQPGGVLVRVDRGAEGAITEGSSHASEAEVDSIDVSFTIDNRRSLGLLDDMVKECMQFIC